MRHAVIIALAPDRRSGIILCPDLLPADQAVARVKEIIAAGAVPDARFPIVQAVAVDGSSTLREHAFRPSQTELLAAIELAKNRPSIAALQAAVQSAETDRDNAMAALAEEARKLELANQRIRDVENLLKAKAKAEADAKVKAEADAKAKAEADAKAKAEADAKAKTKGTAAA